MRVIYFHRKPRKIGTYSVEMYFRMVRENLSDKVSSIIATSRFESNGVLKRIYNTFEAAFRQKKNTINHITGDVHFLTFFLKKRNTILTILDCGILVTSRGLKKLFFKIFWFSIPVRRASLITAISQSTKDELLKYVKCEPDKIIVIHVFISPKFLPVVKDFNNKKPVLLQVGITPNKNIYRLIEAIKGIPCTLEIVGEPDTIIVDKLIADKIDYKIFIDLTEDELVERYNQCDIVTFVSTHEGFGMPIIEANAVGKPVITSNVSSMPEVAGNSACLVNPYSVDEIRNGILKIINDEKYRCELIKAGFENAKRYNADEITNKYYSVYSQLLS